MCMSITGNKTRVHPNSHLGLNHNDWYSKNVYAILMYVVHTGNVRVPTDSTPGYYRYQPYTLPVL